MFVPSKPFLPSLMFAVKPRAYLSEANLKCSCVGSWPDPQTLERPESPPRKKRSSLLWTFVNYGCKKFYNIGPRRMALLWKNLGQCYKPFWYHNTQRNDIQHNDTLHEELICDTWGQCYKTFYRGNLLPFHGNTIILCYKAILPW